jgi:hypothetical protein
MSHIDSLLDNSSYLDVIKDFICLTYYDDDNMFRINEKMKMGSYIHVVNRITSNKTESIFKDANLGSIFSISEAFDDYIDLIVDDLTTYEYCNIVDDWVDDSIDYLRLLDELVNEQEPLTMTISNSYDLKFELNTKLGKEIYRRGLLELSGRFMSSLLEAVVCLQKAVRRKIQKRQARKVLIKTIEHFDTSTVSAIVSSYL